jgi:anti-sigma regulatory factor (Ser/Thr protein kinase)
VERPGTSCSSRLHFRFSWPATSEAAGAARRALDVLPLRGPRDRVDELRLLVSEVVTNAVLHAELPSNQRIDMLVQLAPDSTRVEVRDRGKGFEPLTPPQPGTVGGLGMVVVDRMARRWGVSGSPHFGVWFDLDGGYRSPAEIPRRVRAAPAPEAPWERMAG